MKLHKSILLFVFVGAVGMAHAADRLKLDGTAIIGTRELPKVLYIVPWKNTRLGALSSLAERGTFEGAMAPLDRNIYQRELGYHSMLKVDVSNAGQ